MPDFDNALSRLHKPRVYFARLYISHPHWAFNPLILPSIEEI